MRIFVGIILTWTISVNLYVFSDDANTDPASLTLGDIKLTDEQKRTLRLRNAYVLTRKWTNNIVPYTMRSDIEQNLARKSAIENAIRIINTSTCIKWVPRTNEINYVQFIDGGAGQCYSFVGMIGKIPQDISIGSGCDRAVGTILHEMMHTLGFMHEHMRPDRDQYITVVTAKIKPDMLNQFTKLNPTSVDEQNLGYDYNSIMHYPGVSFSIDGSRTILTKDPSDQSKLGQRRGFSQCDLEKLNKWYGCTALLKNDPTCAMGIQPINPGVVTTTPETKPPMDCSDLNPVVCRLASKNCLNYPGYYLRICRKTCNNCDGNICMDSNLSVFDTLCKSVKKGNCQDNEKLLCPKSCGTC